MHVFLGAGLVIYSSSTSRQSLAFQYPFYSSFVSSRRATRMAYSLSNNDADWQELCPDALVAAPCLIEQTLCQPHSGDHESGSGTSVHQYALPQLAGSVDYARAILDAWRNEIETSVSSAQQSWPNVEWKRVQYADSHGSPLYGHLVRQRVSGDDATVVTATTTSTTNDPTVAVLLFATAAGPHDVFLLWKAAALVHSLSTRDSAQTETKAANVVVLIADVISDETGWGWHTEDRSRYLAARTELLQCFPSSTGNEDDNHPSVVRRLLQDRIWAAVQLVESHVASITTATTTATTTIHWAALGWCLGGQVIAEMARLEPPRWKLYDDSDQSNDPLSLATPVNGDDDHRNDCGSTTGSRVKCMVTFHGVFEGLLGGGGSGAADTALSPDSDDHCPTTCSLMKDCEILICHGVQDPFVPRNTVEGAL
jgi:hypothetical protein